MTRFVLAALAIVAVGCGAPKKIHYYQLSAVPAPVASDAGPVIVVGRIATPQALQDGRIYYREGLHEVGGYEYHRWTEPPGILVHDALLHTLRASGKFKAVQDSASTAAGDYSVRGKLLEFGEIDNPGIQTHVSLELELREIKTGKLIWSQVFTRDEPVTAKVVADVVHSLDQNLQAVLRDAASQIASKTAR